MYTGMLHLHSVLRWVILILLLIVILKSIADRNKPYTTGHRKNALFLLISADIMLLVGIYQWITGPWGLKLIKSMGMEEVMKNPVMRFFAIEHMVGMLISIILIHVGYSYSKKNLPDRTKHNRTLIFFGLALLIILVFVPWPFRTVGAGRGWLPGM